MRSHGLFAVPHRVIEGCAVDSDSDRGKKRGVRVRTPPYRRCDADYCLMIQTLISGFTSACRRMPTR